MHSSRFRRYAGFVLLASFSWLRSLGFVLLAMLCTVSCGCSQFLASGESIEPVQVAEEDSPATADWTPPSPYVIEPPDIILIDAVKIVPKSPYKVDTFDHLQIIVTGTLIDLPISGNFQVEPEGTVNFGPAYGRVKLAGLSIDEARDEVDRHLWTILKEPLVSLSLAQSAGVQQITGEHLVGPDGTVNLGTYGSAYVAGMTLVEAKEAVEQHLSKYLDDPEVVIDMFAYNSNVYYIITEAEFVRMPVREGETVLVAIARINGMTEASSKNIWIARRSPGECDVILPVDWADITSGASTATNYQVLPGDRIYIADEDRLSLFDSLVGRVMTPVERIFGFKTLGVDVLQTINRFPDDQ
jgi:polysaccharide export outer membrane protein